MSEQTLNDRIESATAQAKEAVQKLQDRAVELKGQLQETATSKLEPLRESTEKAAQEQSEKLKQAADKLLTQLEIEARLGAILNRLGMPTSNDLKALDKKLNSLTRKVRKLEKATA